MPAVKIGDLVLHDDEAKHNVFKADALQPHTPASVGSIRAS